MGHPWLVSQKHQNITRLTKMHPQASYPTPSTGHDDNEPDPTKAKLERLSAVVVHAINSRDFTFQSKEAKELILHIAPDFKAQLDTTGDPRTVDWDEQVSRWRQRAEEFPNVQFHILHVDISVDSTDSHASVYMDMEVTGIGDVKLQAMNEVKWKKVGGPASPWVLYFVIGMRGSQANSGGFD